MKQKKLLEKLKHFFDLNEREKRKQKSDIKDILKKLKKKERKLRDKLDEENDEGKCLRIQQEIDIIYAQRTKGVNLLQELKQGEAEK